VLFEIVAKMDTQYLSQLGRRAKTVRAFEENRQNGKAAATDEHRFAIAGPFEDFPDAAVHEKTAQEASKTDAFLIDAGPITRQRRLAVP
jgi:hypothetical protein